MEKPNSEDLRSHAFLTGILIAFLLLALPLAVWLDLTNLAEAALRRQATDLNSVISSVRGYYATNVVGRVLANPGSTKVVHNYEAVPGAIPIPATLSLELGRVIGAQQENINYRFVSDFLSKIEHRTNWTRSKRARWTVCATIPIKKSSTPLHHCSATKFGLSLPW